ncbi:serine protease grass-like isoform X6 [Epargyreus clarus]|uniref:serine protease grass-like isoform X6 n=1 Tax=Epargyreus clarus TaxID=520877 RepID=UPI003C2EB6D1
METIIIISSLCFVGGTLALKKCSDCKNYDECPAIKIFKRRDGTIPLDDNTILLIRKEICGTDEISDTKQDISVEKVHVHPDYAGMPNLANDIALLRLAEPIDLNQDNIDAVCLPTTPTLRQQSLLNGTAFVAGWGLTENKTSSSILLKANLTVNSNDNCLKLYNRFPAEGQPKYTENKLCAGRTATGTCTGDSGGPLMLPKWFNRGFKYVQYGIISEGKSGCGSDFPELFTDVTKYMSWILNTIAK